MTSSFDKIIIRNEVPLMKKKKIYELWNIGLNILIILISLILLVFAILKETFPEIFLFACILLASSIRLIYHYKQMKK